MNLKARALVEGKVMGTAMGTAMETAMAMEKVKLQANRCNF